MSTNLNELTLVQLVQMVKDSYRPSIYYVVENITIITSVSRLNQSLMKLKMFK
jgi:hypothetical protein